MDEHKHSSPFNSMNSSQINSGPGPIEVSGAGRLVKLIKLVASLFIGGLILVLLIFCIFQGIVLLFSAISEFFEGLSDLASEGPAGVVTLGMILIAALGAIKLFQNKRKR